MNLISFDYGLESVQTGQNLVADESLPSPAGLMPQRPLIENNTESLYQTADLCSALLDALTEPDDRDTLAFRVDEFHQVCGSTLAAVQQMNAQNGCCDPVLEAAQQVLLSLNNDRQHMLNYLRALTRG